MDGLRSPVQIPSTNTQLDVHFNLRCGFPKFLVTHLATAFAGISLLVGDVGIALGDLKDDIRLHSYLGNTLVAIP